MLAAPWSDANDSGSAKNFITLFSIDPQTHDLNPPAGFMFPASGAGQDAIFDPSGEFLFTAQDNGVGVYKVGPNSLTEVSGSPFGEAEMDRVMLTPLGKFVVAISRATGKNIRVHLRQLDGIACLGAGLSGIDIEPVRFGGHSNSITTWSPSKQEPYSGNPRRGQH